MPATTTHRPTPSRGIASAGSRAGRRRAGAVIGLATSLVAGPARANDMSGLVFLVAIWPVGLFFIIALAIFATVAAVRMSKGRATKGLAKGLRITAIAIALAYLVFSVAAGSGASGVPVRAWLVTLLPVELLAAGCLWLAGAVARRAP